MTEKEQKLYEMLYSYCSKENKLAFPMMNEYDLSAKLIEIQSSSTRAILQTIKSFIKRLKNINDSEKEIEELKTVQKAAEEIKIDSKAKLLITILKNGFQLLKKTGANKKAVIFTISVVTQRYLYDYLKDIYKTVTYNGSNYSVIKEFKNNAEILISTDYEDMGVYFYGYEGCFVLYDFNNDKYSIYNKNMSLKRNSPNSTYKIYSALFALDSGKIDINENILNWDGFKYSFEQWNKNQDLNSAMSNSVNWYFNQLDNNVGKHD